VPEATLGNVVSSEVEKVLKKENGTFCWCATGKKNRSKDNCQRVVSMV